MRLQCVRRCAHEVRRALLPRFDPFHHLRSGSRVSLPLGYHARYDGCLRFLVDGCLSRRADGRLHLRMEKGSARMGVIAQGTAARAGVEDGAPIRDTDPYFKALQGEMADKGFLVANLDSLVNWARTGSLMWMTF